MNQRELFLRHVAQTSPIPMLGMDINIESAKGIYLTDNAGKRYIDLISGISVSVVGHGHPKVVKAVQNQAKKYMHLMVYGEYNQSSQVAYATSLSKLLPIKLSSVFFTTGGSEATEGALKLVKRVTGRPEIICFSNAYHGSTSGALAVCGNEELKKAYRPLMPGVKVMDFNDVSQLKIIGEQTAAVIVEPVQGEAGVRPATDEFLREIRYLCDKNGSLLIFDEIQTGFGRTGSLFCFEHSAVIPDIMLIGKGMGGGMPIGAFVASKQLMDHFTYDPALGHINTFGGNAVCVEAARATLDVILERDLPARAMQIGKQINEQLKHPLIKEIRASGALCAVEFGNEELNFNVIKKCIEAGVISDWFLFCPTAMRVAPPLTISDEELAEATGKIMEVLNNLSTH